MTAAVVSADALKVRLTSEEKRARILGGIYFALALFVLWAFALGVDSSLDSTFKLSLPRDRIKDIELAVNTRLVGYLVATVLAFLGGVQLTRGFAKRGNLVLGIGLLLFVVSFLAWAAAGKSFSLVGMLTSTVLLSVPVTLGGLTGVMCERVAIINIGIEGQLLSAAFVGTIVG